MHFFILFILLFSNFSKSSAQNGLKDSMIFELQNLNSASHDYNRKKAELQHRILEINITTQSLDSTLRDIENLAALYKFLGSEEQYHEIAFQKKGLAYQHHDSLVNAILSYRKYAEYLKNKNIKEQNGFFYIDLGNVYMNLSLYRNAEKYYQKAAEIFNIKTDLSGLANAYDNLSVVYEKLGDIEKAYKNANLAFLERKKNAKNSYEIAYQHYSLGLLAKKFGNINNEALQNFSEAKTILSDTTFKSSQLYSELKWVLPLCIFETARIYGANNNIEALMLSVKELEILLKEYPKDDIIQSLPFFLNGIKLNSEKRYKESIDQLELILTKFEAKYQNRKIILGVYEELIRLSEKTSDMFRLYKYSYILTKLNESNKENQNRDDLLAMNALLLELENEQKIETQENELAEKELKAKQEKSLRLFLITLLLLALIAISIFVYQRKLLQKKNLIISTNAEKLRKADQTKSLLLSVIGHDLRAPFNAIFRSIQLSKLYHPDQKIKEELNHISDASKNAYLTLESLMQWITVEQEDFVAKKGPQNLEIIFQELLRALDAIILSRELKIEIDLSISIVNADRNMLLIVLRNLLHNAVKYSPFASKINIGSCLKNNRIQIYIKNNGFISKEKLIELNSPQSSQSITAKASGLGLELVKNFSNRLEAIFNINNSENNKVVSVLEFSNISDYSQNENYSDSKNKDTLERIVIKEEDLKQLKKVSMELSKYEIFESTELKKILYLEKSDSEVLEQWKNEIIKAIFELDETKFEALKNIDLYVSTVGK
jgi:hypothetical protein